MDLKALARHKKVPSITSFNSKSKVGKNNLMTRNLSKLRLKTFKEDMVAQNEPRSILSTARVSNTQGELFLSRQGSSKAMNNLQS